MKLNCRSLPVMVCALALFAGTWDFPSQRALAAEVNPANEEQSTLYAVGLAFAQQLGAWSLNAEELALVQEGLADGVLGREHKVSLEEFGPKIRDFAQNRARMAAAAEKTASGEFLSQQAEAPGAVLTESGLVVFELTAGTGASPTATDQVRVHYHGTLRDGTVFDSSVQRNSPAEFGLNQVIPCWTEALQQMKVGGKIRVVCPSERAYGDQGRPPRIPGGAALVFEVELLEILDPAATAPDS